MRLDILSVDDNLIINQIQSGIVEGLGHRVQRAMSGEAALALLATQHFDVVLMDIQMPNMDGLQTTQAMRARGIKTPVIAVTGHDTAEDVASFKLAGMNGFVAKPIQSDLLAVELARVCGR